MAGAFGFESGKYEISVAIGEMELLPAVRKASPDCLIIADGFSCREQISQCTNRHALHLAEVIQLAAQHEDGSPELYPERPQVEGQKAQVTKSMTRAGVGLAGIAAGAAAFGALRRRRRCS